MNGLHLWFQQFFSKNVIPWLYLNNSVWEMKWIRVIKWGLSVLNRVVCLEASVPHLYPNVPWLNPPSGIKLGFTTLKTCSQPASGPNSNWSGISLWCCTLFASRGHVRCWLGLSSTCSRAFLSFLTDLNVKIIYYALFSYRLVPQGETASCSRTHWCTGVLGQTSGKVPCWSPKGSSRKDSLKWQEIPCRSCEGIKQKIYRIQRNEFFKSLTA